MSARGSRDEWDVIVVGAGPAGCLCAHQLGRLGARVLLLDRAPLGRDKVCGEGLLPRGASVLRAAGLGAILDGTPTFAGIEIHAPKRGSAGERPVPPVSPARPVRGLFAGSPGHGVRRTALDLALAEAAVGVGAALRFETQVDAASASLRGCEVMAGRERHRGRVLVIADGGRSPLGRMLGRGGPPRATARVGVVTHAELRWDGADPPDPFSFAAPAASPATAGTGQMVVAILEPAWQAVLTPVAGGAISVAALFDAAPLRLAARRGETPTDWLRSILGARGLSIGAMTPPRCTPLLPPQPISPRPSARGSALVSDGVVFIGDAAGAVDPIIGCGISLALEGAEHAARAIGRALDGRGPEARAFAGYARFRSRQLRLPRLVARTMLLAARNPMVARLLGAALDHGALADLAVRLVAS